MEFANNHEAPDLILDRLASLRGPLHTRQSALDSYRFAAALVEALHGFVRRGKDAIVSLSSHKNAPAHKSPSAGIAKVTAKVIGRSRNAPCIDLP